MTKAQLNQVVEGMFQVLESEREITEDLAARLIRDKMSDKEISRALENIKRSRREHVRFELCKILEIALTEEVASIKFDVPESKEIDSIQFNLSDLSHRCIHPA